MLDDLVAEDLHAEVEGRLRAADQRYTSGRRALVAALAGAGRPVTMPEVLARVEGLPQSSAYRNLTVLVDAGVARRLAGPDDLGRFELAEDLVGHHHHLICTECGRVDDFTVPAPLERSLEAAFAKAVSGTGFQSTSHRLDLIGTCEACQA
jgi:Fe2+ or Zn2+ uptake regulation protein